MLSQQVVARHSSFQYAGDYCPDQEYSSPIAKESKECAEESDSLDNKEEAFTQTEDKTAGSSAAKALLPVEEIAIPPGAGLRRAITSNEAQDDEQQPDTTASLKLDDALLAGFRIGYRQDAAQTAQNTLKAGATATQSLLQMAGWVQEMKSRLNRKEFGAFVKGLLQWVGDEARKYLAIAKRSPQSGIACVFDGFDLSRLARLEPFTILKLRSKKYAPVVERLREESIITLKLVQDLIKELLPKQSRKKQDSQSGGWKQCRSGGGRLYEVQLYDEQTGLLIEQQAESEGILPQRVIAEAVALRAQQKSLEVNELVTTFVEEPQTMGEQRASLASGNESRVQLQESDAALSQAQDDRTSASEVKPQTLVLPPSSECQIAELEAQLTEGISGVVASYVGILVEKQEYSNEQSQAATSSDEPVEVFPNTTITQTHQPSESIDSPQKEQTISLEPSSAPSAEECQSTPPWQQLRVIRELEGYVQTVDSQIQEITSKLVKPDLDRTVERELKNILASRQKLRNTKLSEIVAVGDENGIPVTSEELQSTGRLAIADQLASNWLRQAQTWEEVMLVVGCNRTVLLNSVKNWALEQKQVLSC